MSRPTEMDRNAEVCLDCGLCEDIARDVSWHTGGVPITPTTLDAMAACPVGAIVWREEENRGAR